MNKLKMLTYGCIPKSLLGDTRLSWEAIGLGSYLSSILPDSPESTLEAVINMKHGQEEVIKSAIKELEKYGYLERNYNWELSMD